PFEALYSTNHDALIVFDGEESGPTTRGGDPTVHPGYLKKGMSVLDARVGMKESHLVREAKERGCAVVGPRQLWLEQVTLQARILTGKDVPKDLLAGAAPWLLEEE